MGVQAECSGSQSSKSGSTTVGWCEQCGSAGGSFAIVLHVGTVTFNLSLKGRPFSVFSLLARACKSLDLLIFCYFKYL